MRTLVQLVLIVWASPWTLLGLAMGLVALASGENANEVHAEAQSAGLPHPLITFIEEPLPARRA